MAFGKLIFSTDGMTVDVFKFDEAGNHCTLTKGGSLRDATEAMEYEVIVMMQRNKVGYFNPDGTISAMVTNVDLRQKCQKVIDATKG